MSIAREELRQNRGSWILWTASISILIAICISLFPTLKKQQVELHMLFASMGSFFQAFGMDRIDIGTLIGFYAVECGTILSLGGGVYGALLGVSMLVKEERDGTAEFLLAHPIGRPQVVSEKLVAMVLQITALNLVVFTVALVTITLIGEPIPWKELGLLHLAQYLMQLELASICFGISACMHRGGPGVGMGLTAILYFLNIVGNISESASFLHYLTPYAYTEAADIVLTGELPPTLVTLGMVYGILGILLAYGRYTRKDLH